MMIHKLRSYNKYRKQFIYFQNGIYYKDIKCEYMYQCSENLFDWKNAQVWIGNHAKNKKEIFVGDIFEVDEDDYKYMIVGYDPWKMSFMFKIYGGEFNGCVLDQIFLYNIVNMEIIGNDKENKDLLK